MSDPTTTTPSGRPPLTDAQRVLWRTQRLMASKGYGWSKAVDRAAESTRKEHTTMGIQPNDYKHGTRTTPLQARILDAVAAGHTGYRAIMQHAAASSLSVVRYNVHTLASREQLVLERTPQGVRIYDGRDFAAAWDSAARLAGNPDA